MGENNAGTNNNKAIYKYTKYEFDGAYFSLTASEKEIEAECYLPALLNESGETNSDEVTHITLLEQCQTY